MGKSMGLVERLEDHPNLTEVLGVLAQLAHITDDDLVKLAEAWTNTPGIAEARDRALSPDSPLVCEVLSAFDSVSALFADDIVGDASYVAVRPEITIVALKAVRDAIAAAYARPILRRNEHEALMRPWRAVYPASTAAEPDLGPHTEQVKSLLNLLPQLAHRCHDEIGQVLFDSLVDRSYVAESDRAEAAEAAFEAAVLTSRRRMWALIRRSVTEALSRPCSSCRGGKTEEGEREYQRVLQLCSDAACALLVTDAAPDSVIEVLLEPVTALIPLQRRPDPSI